MMPRWLAEAPVIAVVVVAVLLLEAWRGRKRKE